MEFRCVLFRSIFTFGSITWNTGVVLTTVFAGVLNISNTFGSLKGSVELFGTKTTKKDYLASFSVTGFTTIVVGVFVLVLYEHYVSSIGFLRQSIIYD